MLWRWINFCYGHGFIDSERLQLNQLAQEQISDGEIFHFHCTVGEVFERHQLHLADIRNVFIVIDGQSINCITIYYDEAFILQNK